jgi:transcriptional regulator with XRE-family HTH domain
MMGNRITKELESVGLSVEKVADVIGVHPNTIRGWERGDYEPNGRNLVQLSTLFGCTPEYLVGLSDDRNSSIAAAK